MSQTNQIPNEPELSEEQLKLAEHYRQKMFNQLKIENKKKLKSLSKNNLVNIIIELSMVIETLKLSSKESK